MDSLRGLLGIRGMDRDPNARIRELCGVKKGVDERINDEGVLLWFGPAKRMGKDRIGNRVYVESVLAVAQWEGLGRNGLIPCRSV